MHENHIDYYDNDEDVSELRTADMSFNWGTALNEVMRVDLLLKIVFLWVFAYLAFDLSWTMAGVIVWTLWFLRVFLVWWRPDFADRGWSWN